MSIIRHVVGYVFVMLLAGCASMQNAPTADERQALAPKGTLRVALWLGSPAHVVKDPKSGEMKGVGYDLGREVASRAGLSFEPVMYPAIGPLLDGAKSNAWDIAFVGVNPDRGRFLDFSDKYIEIEFGYLVPADSRISTIADVDKSGVRIAVPDRGAADVFLTGALKSATIIRAGGLTGSLDLVKSGKADVFAANKSNLFEISSQLPGSRVLDGRPGSEEQAIAMPKGRDLGINYVRRFVEEAKASGLVAATMERAGLRGAVVAK